GSGGGGATIDNGGLSIEDAEVQLAAGTIRRAAPPRPPQPRMMAGVAQRQMELSAITVTAAEEEDVGEVRIYTLPGRLDLEPGVQTSAALFGPTSTEVTREYAFEPTGMGMQLWAGRADSNVHPDVSYRLKRPAGPTFGGPALPQGAMRIYAADTAGHLQLLGEQSIGHTPRGQDVTITTGTAFEISGERSQTTYERRGEREAISGMRYTIHNGKD